MHIVLHIQIFRRDLFQIYINPDCICDLLSDLINLTYFKLLPVCCWLEQNLPIFNSGSPLTELATVVSITGYEFDGFDGIFGADERIICVSCAATAAAAAAAI